MITSLPMQKESGSTVLRVKPSYFAPIEEKLRSFFYETYFKPLLETAPVPLKNAAGSALLTAINSGRVTYKDGVFSGTYNAAISRELSSFATFDKRSKTWKGRPSSNIIAASLQAETKRKQLIEELNRKIEALSDKVEESIRTLSFGLDLPLFAMDRDIAMDLKGVGVKPVLHERTAEKLRKDYNESQKLNVKNWNAEQIQRLRNAVEEYQTTETAESLIDIIQREWQVSANKASFLARQETSLFFSKLSMNRAKDSGIRRYRWSTSHDIRVRPEHKELQGTVHSVDDPPIVDRKKGRRAHPGEDFGCRCAAIWVLE